MYTTQFLFSTFHMYLSLHYIQPRLDTKHVDLLVTNQKKVNKECDWLFSKVHSVENEEFTLSLDKKSRENIFV